MKRHALKNGVKSEAVSRDVVNSRTQIVKGWPPSASTMRVLQSCRVCHLFVSTVCKILRVEIGKGKGKIHLRRGHEGPGGRRCI